MLTPCVCKQSDSLVSLRLGLQATKQIWTGLDASLAWTQHQSMKAKLFQHRGGQAVRLPKGFHFEGTEVLIEKRGDAVILRPVPLRRPEFRTVNDIARYLAEKYPDAADFPDPPPRPKEHERPILEW